MRGASQKAAYNIRKLRLDKVVFPSGRAVRTRHPESDAIRIVDTRVRCRKKGQFGIGVSRTCPFASEPLIRSERSDSQSCAQWKRVCHPTGRNFGPRKHSCPVQKENSRLQRDESRLAIDVGFGDSCTQDPIISFLYSIFCCNIVFPGDHEQRLTVP